MPSSARKKKRTMRGTNTINTMEGTYTVTVADPYGCSASASATVNWRDFPWVHFGPTRVDVCAFGRPKIIAADGDRIWEEMIWLDGLYEGVYERITSLIDTVNVIRVRNAFFFCDTATPEIYTLSLHDALPI